MSGYAIVIGSEELEKVQAASMIAAVAVVSDYELDVFVTMNALTAFEKEVVENRDFKTEGRVGELMLDPDTETQVPLFTEQLEQAKMLGELGIYACTMAMDLQGNALDDYIDLFDDELGVSGFLGLAEDKEVIFI